MDTPPPPQQPSGEKPNCPAPPPTPPCPGNANVVLVSDGSWFSDIAVNHTTTIVGDQTSRVEGYTSEFIDGTKKEFVYGHVMEVYRIQKHEQIIGLETKILIGGQIEMCFINKNELSLAAMIEHEGGSKWHLFVKGRRKIINGEDLKTALKEEFLGQFNESYDKLEKTVGAAVESAKNSHNEYNHMKQDVGLYEFKVGKLKEVSSKASWESGSITRNIKGTEKVTANSNLTVSASSSVSIKGKKVQLKGSGAKVICASGKIHCFGTKLIVTK